MSTSVAPEKGQRTTKGAMEYHRSKRDSGSRAYEGRCLVLAREARNIDAYWASALSAQVGTPREERIYGLENVRKGMVGFFDDPFDSNRYGHIATCAGRDNAGELLWWTNDAEAPGAVSVVRHSYFPQQWGDPFQFAAISLNGQMLKLDAKPGPAIKGTPTAILDSVNEIGAAIERLNDAIEFHKKKNHEKLVVALKGDRQRLREVRRALRKTIDRFDG